MSASSIVHTVLSDHVRIILLDSLNVELPADLEVLVDEIWQTEKAKRDLYDSFLFSVHSFNETRIIGHYVNYRYYIATRKLPELQELMQIYPLGISGICLSNNCVLTGIRDQKVANYGGYLECVPSGSIEPRAFMHGEVDFVAQCMWELAEEARISEKKVTKVKQLGLFFSPEDGIYDMGLQISLDLVEQEMQHEPTSEYPLLNWYTYEEFDRILAKPDVKVIPLTRALWQSFRQ